jgi:hypothetical protein
VFDSVKLVGIRFDLYDCYFTGVPPLALQITDMRYVFMRALVVRLIDTSYFVFCHMFFLSSSHYSRLTAARELERRFAFALS